MFFPITQGEEQRAGDKYEASEEKNEASKVTIRVSPVIILNGTPGGGNDADIKAAFEDKINKQIAFLEKNGVPFKIAKMTKLWLIIDVNALDSNGQPKLGQFGPSPVKKFGNRALTINPLAYSGLSGQALINEVGNTVGHELGHAFMDIGKGLKGARDHRRIEAFGR